MSRLLCCLCARAADMGAALSHAGPQDVEACDGAAPPAAPPTMADVIRERKKKAGGAGLGTIRRRIAAATRRPRDSRSDRGCEHSRTIRSVVSSWRLAEVFLLCEELEAGAALRDLSTQAELARAPAPHLAAALHAALRDRWWCDIELLGAGYTMHAHRAILSARCSYFRELLQHYPRSMYRVPLEGAGAALSRAELEAVVAALYTGQAAVCSCDKYERNVEDDLDIINVDGTNSRRSSTCACAASRVDAAALRRLGAALGFSLHSLHTDMKYLLDSGELADARLQLDAHAHAHAQRCHRLVLAARSRFFRNVMSRRSASAAPFDVCLDEKVLPRRFVRALLHAAYTDQVDLSLIGRNSSTPASATSSSSGTTPWSSVSRGRTASAAMLEDAFQLYEIARFVEMPIVAQGCEDAIAEALCPESLPAALRWAALPHASAWVHRQAMRYLRDEFVSIMSHSAAARLPRQAVTAALGSPFLQASEAQALRALLRYAERVCATNREPNVVWHTAHSVSRLGARRRDVNEAALRELLAPLVPLLRVEHLPPDCEPLQQLIRRGIIAAPPEPCPTLAAWQARGSYRPPRCFLPYLDELKALLEEQEVPEAELARARRAKNMHRIPDTLYMVAAARTNDGSSTTVNNTVPAECVCISARTRGALLSRMRELRAAPAATRALGLRACDSARVLRQIALRAVREMSLPDTCAELIMNEADLLDTAPERESASNKSRGSGEWECERDRRENRESRERDRDSRSRRWESDDDCCSSASAGGSLRHDASLRHRSLLLPSDSSRPGTCRREPQRGNADQTSPCAGAAAPPRLSAAVPDVAMAPNANTHLLTAPTYFRHQTQYAAEYSGGVLQLDLGDGATHTPRPGSRAARAQAQLGRARGDDGRAIELSVIHAYSSLHAGAAQLPRLPAPRCRALHSDTLPQRYRDISHTALGVAGPQRARPPPSAGRGRGASRSPSPRLHHDYTHRSDAGYGSPAAGSRSHSPRE
ncbi:BTB/POZ domain-containing protein 7 isoform X2 [Plodia interpunctella]|uniref:BTB/POZ domain-containing protein 7 isoform X2 n=1 Tax=Plodia interpunctella TaxID=58824 RepID=UPI002367C64D|nr:BTB/POZ domain-containing protein 7 isoform X2 [Plodia interpunctella]